MGTILLIEIKYTEEKLAAIMSEYCPLPFPAGSPPGQSFVVSNFLRDFETELN